MASSRYEVVIGLEVHAQMKTKSKIFCGCSTEFGNAANAQICPVCAGFPGVLPVLNRTAVEMAVKTGLAIDGDVRELSEFSRKNYFYPDQPSGYQITQFELPIVLGGHVAIQVKGEDEKKVQITRIHMEVDAGKSIHQSHATWVDLNRTGTPLMEIVSEPDMRSSAEVGEYLKNLRAIVRYLDVCDGNMEQGSFRCDANVSIRPFGQEAFGTRCELKNMNSIKNVMAAIDYEVERQIDMVENGEKVVQQTRLWDAVKMETRQMRSKEDAHDYRYFPEPDLPPMRLDDGLIDRIRSAMPELPAAKKARFEKEHQLSAYDAGVLTADKALADYFETVADAVAESGKKDPKAAANWVTGELLGLLNKEGKGIDDSPIPAENLGKLIGLIKRGDISGKIAKTVFGLMVETGDDPDKIVADKGLKQDSDAGSIEAEVEKVIAAHPDEVERLKNGEKKLIGFFVGQVMKATRGKANPGMVNQILNKKLQ